MSFPHPQDRNRDRRDKGGQPYKAAKESFAEQEVEIKGGPGQHDEEAHLSDAERTALQQQRAGQRFRKIGDDIDHSE